MKKIKILLILVFVGLISEAQTVLLNVDRKREGIISDRGPNLKNFSHIFLRGGFVSSSDKEGARIIYGNSANFSLGFRRKYKIGSVYSMGFDIQIDYTDYKLKQETDKRLPDSIINNVAGRLDYGTLGIGYYNRFNFDPKRGNFMGTYLDIGIMGEWHYTIEEIAKNELPDGTKIKTIATGLNYPEKLDARVFARLGYSHISLYASYRLTNLFKPSYNYPDLPRLIAGIELAVF